MDDINQGIGAQQAEQSGGQIKTRWEPSISFTDVNAIVVHAYNTLFQENCALRHALAEVSSAYDRQLADVRAKNTALEISNRELRAKLVKIDEADSEFVDQLKSQVEALEAQLSPPPSATNPMGLTLQGQINNYDAALKRTAQFADDLRDENKRLREDSARQINTIDDLRIQLDQPIVGKDGLPPTMIPRNPIAPWPDKPSETSPIPPTPVMGKLFTICYQERVAAWCIQAFNIGIYEHLGERAARLLEETLETVQSLHLSEEFAHAMVRYVFNRTVGETRQEIGGVIVTLALLAQALHFDLSTLGERELERCWNHIASIREKDAGKPISIRPCKWDEKAEADEATLQRAKTFAGSYDKTKPTTYTLMGTNQAENAE